jgi:hypothetical protein
MKQVYNNKTANQAIIKNILKPKKLVKVLIE